MPRKLTPEELGEFEERLANNESLTEEELADLRYTVKCQRELASANGTERSATEIFQEHCEHSEGLIREFYEHHKKLFADTPVLESTSVAEKALGVAVANSIKDVVLEMFDKGGVAEVEDKIVGCLLHNVVSHYARLAVADLFNKDLLNEANEETDNHKEG